MERSQGLFILGNCANEAMVIARNKALCAPSKPTFPHRRGHHGAINLTRTGAKKNDIVVQIGDLNSNKRTCDAPKKAIKAAGFYRLLRGITS
jgi:hypothetical protein